MSIVSTDNRMGRAMQWPQLASNSIALVTDVSAPGSSYQNTSYGMNGLGAVIDDITTGNFAALPGDIITGLNPSTFDIGAYAIVGLLAYLILPKLFKGGKGASRQAYRKARLTGQVAMDQSLLKANPRRRNPSFSSTKKHYIGQQITYRGKKFIVSNVRKLSGGTYGVTVK